MPINRLICNCLLFLSVAPVSWAGAVLSLQPAGSNVFAGAFLNVTLNVAGVSDLYDYQFDLAFDPAVLQLETETEAGFLATGGATLFLPGSVDNVNGTVTFTAGTLLSAVPGVSGTGDLAQLNFLASGSGISWLSLSNVILQDSNGDDIAFSTADGSVTVTPEPSSVVLLAAGLLAAGIVKLRFRAGLPSPSTW